MNMVSLYRNRLGDVIIVHTIQRFPVYFQHALQDGSELIVMLETDTLFIVAVRTSDGRSRRYGDMLKSGEFVKKLSHCPQPKGMEQALAELKKWALAKSVMES